MEVMFAILPSLKLQNNINFGNFLFINKLYFKSQRNTKYGKHGIPHKTFPREMVENIVHTYKRKLPFQNFSQENVMCIINV